MSEVMVSVLCTAYNHEKYIGKCLEGFVKQKTKFSYEVLVHDDASTDGTATIIRNYEKEYPNIIRPIYQKENQFSRGIAITREIIFPKSRGKYVAICEGDDFWTDPYKLQKQIDALEKHTDCEMCVCRVERVSEDEGKVLGYCPGFPLNEGIIPSDRFINIILREYAFHTSSYVFRARLYKEYVEHLPEFARECPVGDEAYMLYFGSHGNVYYCEDTMSCNRRGSIGGWNERTWSDRLRRRRYYEGMIKTYKSFDDYTHGQYHIQCNQKIFMENYFLAERPDDFIKLLMAEDRLFFKQSFRTKMRVLTGAFCNPLLKLYYKTIDKSGMS